MPRISMLTLCIYLLAGTAHAQIPLGNVTVLGSDPAILNFPKAASFDSFGLVQGNMSIRTTGTASWPPVSIGPGEPPSQSGTLWIFLNVNGQWYATGAERLRPTQVNGDKPEGSPSDLVGSGWLYDEGRWGPMAHYNPKPGEKVGLMVVAGSTRSDNNTPVKARTNVIEVLWPDDNGSNPLAVVWNENAPVPPVINPPTPSCPPDCAHGPITIDYTKLLQSIIELQQQQLKLEQDTNAHVINIDKTFVESVKAVAAFAAKYLAPAAAAWVLASQLK